MTNDGKSTIAMRPRVVTTNLAQPIDPARSGLNSTTLQIDPSLSLGAPYNNPQLDDGQYMIKIPEYNGSGKSIQAGSAINTSTPDQPNQPIILSNSVEAAPNINLVCCQPRVFYVAVGDIAVGQPFNFATYQMQAAKCDASSGQSTFNLIYNENGTWSEC